MTTSAPGPDLRVALIGYGKGGAVFHAPLVAATPGLRLAAVVTGDPERAAEVRRRHPDAEVIGAVEDVWRRAAEFDLVVVTTPNDSHVPLARAALAAGLSAVVDKPFALTAADARDLVAEAERRGLVLSAFHNRRWDSDFLTALRLVDEGALGRVHRFESRFDRWRPEAKHTWRDRGERNRGAGLLYDLGSHLVDQAIILFGPVAEVYAELDARREGVRTEDDVFVALTHASGVRSHLWAGALVAQLGPRLRLLGDRGAFTVHGLDSQEERLARGDDPSGADWGEEPKDRWGLLGADGDLAPVPSERGDYPAFYAAVRDAVAEGEPLPVEPHEVIHGLEVIEAAAESARTRRVVRVEPARR
ncbi:Gfo/Idh/MocA family oxidoreductase [Marinitenerispora sediminis]|uniref:Oxidoreductase n=1 Tax=Marinitenerispora sediminis TaxID=1931232 RepID=A0A368TC75_9ACTN|nr:Gfo/Idh/MocA family oxidoreductase [Marinitenerispora sediminis]RCV47697.1 oxidoreductase [Marinitenerispora sediminis]RCV58179.1 oxidoreductase [Marinitenerispora sediminis]RCV62550.1 oxidoreductase [Marinitenerispora sediminis]